MSRKFRPTAIALLLPLTICCLGCPEAETPLPRQSTPSNAATNQTEEDKEDALSPRDLLGVWVGEVWQVKPAGPWIPEKAARFVLARDKAAPGDSPPRPDETADLSKFPSIEIKLTVEEKHLATPGIAGSSVELTYRKPNGAGESASPPKIFMIKTNGEGQLFLHAGINELRVESLEEDQLKLNGKIVGVGEELISARHFTPLLHKQSPAATPPVEP